MVSRNIAALFITIVSLVLVESNFKKNLERCNAFGKKPYFDPSIVLGPQWRFYYTWNSRSKGNCLAMKFHSLNPSIVSRFHREMSQYLTLQPLWGAAILYVTIGASKHQMLLFASYGPAGKVHAVPNLTRDPVFQQYKRKGSVPLLHYQLKLLQGGKYLVMMDCVGGTISLSARDGGDATNDTDIESVAKKLSFGKPVIACPIKRNTTTTTQQPEQDAAKNATTRGG